MPLKSSANFGFHSLSDSFNYSELLSHSTLLPKSLKIDFLFDLYSAFRSPESPCS